MVCSVGLFCIFYCSVPILGPHSPILATSCQTRDVIIVVVVSPKQIIGGNIGCDQQVTWQDSTQDFVQSPLLKMAI